MVRDMNYLVGLGGNGRNANEYYIYALFQRLNKKIYDSDSAFNASLSEAGDRTTYSNAGMDAEGHIKAYKDNRLRFDEMRRARTAFIKYLREQNLDYPSDFKGTGGSEDCVLLSEKFVEFAKEKYLDSFSLDEDDVRCITANYANWAKAKKLLLSPIDPRFSDMKLFHNDNYRSTKTEKYPDSPDEPVFDDSILAYFYSSQNPNNISKLIEDPNTKAKKVETISMADADSAALDGLHAFDSYVPTSDMEAFSLFSDRFADGLKAYAAKGKDEDGNPIELSDEDCRKIMDDQIDKAKAIIKYLRDSGRDFNFSFNQSRGYMQVCLKDTPLSPRVSLFDVAHYRCGAIYDFNVITEIESDETMLVDAGNGRKSIKKARPNVFEVTPEDCVNLLDYYLGNDVKVKVDGLNNGNKNLSFLCKYLDVDGKPLSVDKLTDMSVGSSYYFYRPSKQGQKSIKYESASYRLDPDRSTDSGTTSNKSASKGSKSIYRIIPGYRDEKGVYHNEHRLRFKSSTSYDLRHMRSFYAYGLHDDYLKYINNLDKNADKPSFESYVEGLIQSKISSAKATFDIDFDVDDFRAQYLAQLDTIMSNPDGKQTRLPSKASFVFTDDAFVDSCHDAFLNKINERVREERKIQGPSYRPSKEIFDDIYEDFKNQWFGWFVMGDEDYPSDSFMNIENVIRYDTSEETSMIGRSAGFLVDMLRICRAKPSQIFDPTNESSRSAAALADELVYYSGDDADTAKSLAVLKSVQPPTRPLTIKCMEEVKSILKRTGCIITDDDIFFDTASNIIHYKGKQQNKAATTKVQSIEDQSTFMDIDGYVGQVFEPDPNLGIVLTNYAASKNRYFVPGYEGWYVSNDECESLSNRDRVRLLGYEQGLLRSVRNVVMANVIGPAVSNHDDYKDLSYCARQVNINDFYRTVYSAMRIDPEIFNMRMHESSPEDVEDFKVAIKSKAKRAHFSSEYSDSASTRAQSMLDNPHSAKAANFDYHVSDFIQNENIRELSREYDGMFDSRMTGNAKSQGTVKYLVDSVDVDENCKPIVHNANGTVSAPKREDNDKNIVRKSHYFRHSDYDAWDRLLMAVGQYHDCQRVARDIHVAYTTVDGWNFNDGKPISKEFAEKYMAYYEDSNGETKLRPLMIGDKISDFHGNKGVVSYVVDRNMPLEEAKEKGIYNLVKLFKDNPELDIVEAPYSGVSRYNAGTYRDLFEGEVSDLILPNGEIEEGGMSTCNFIIVDKTVDEKTKVYSDEDVIAGKGRKASATLSAAFDSKKAWKLKKFLYNTNDGPVNDLREYLILLGKDIGVDGKLLFKYTPQSESEHRYVFDLPDMDSEIPYVSESVRATRKDKDVSEAEAAKRRRYIKKHMISLPGLKDYTLNSDTAKIDNVSGLPMIEGQVLQAMFANVVRNKGGFLKVPFNLTYDSFNQEGEAVRDDLVKSDDTWVDANGDEHPYYLLPVLPPNLRVDMQTEGDSNMSYNDLMKDYMNIFEHSVRYMQAEQHSVGTGEFWKSMSQSWFNDITNTIITRKFSSKYGIIRDGLMANRLTHSATAVWTEDPTLKMNEMAVGPDMVKELGISDDALKSGEPVRLGVWRDPVWRDGGFRCFNLVVKEGLTGVAINPLNDLSFDGDFDGDSVAVHYIPRTTEEEIEASDEEYRLFSPHRNMLNFGQPMDENGNYPLYFDISLDVMSNMACRPELKDSLREIEDEANRIYRKYRDLNKNLDSKSVSYEDAEDKEWLELFDKFNDWAHDALTGVGADVLSFKSVPTLVQKVQTIVDHKAKGSNSKMDDLFDYMGVEYERDEETGKVIPSSIVDTHKPKKGLDRDEILRIQLTYSIKADNTGLGGTMEQNAHKAFRDSCALAACELTYPITQAILQSKHDPADALSKDKILQHWAPHILNGFRLTGNWDADAKTIQEEDHVICLEEYTFEGRKGFRKVRCATKEEWISQVRGMFRALNVDINIEHAETIVNHMMDVDKKGRDFVAGFDKTASDKGSVLDKIAYYGFYKALCDSCLSNENIFGSDSSSCFKPQMLSRTNKEIILGSKSSYSSEATDAKTGYHTVHIAPTTSIIKPEEVLSEEAVESAMESAGIEDSKAVANEVTTTIQNIMSSDGAAIDVADNIVAFSDKESEKDISDNLAALSNSDLFDSSDINKNKVPRNGYDVTSGNNVADDELNMKGA